MRGQLEELLQKIFFAFFQLYTHLFAQLALVVTAHSLRSTWQNYQVRAQLVERKDEVLSFFSLGP